jgi:hypothetical protein
LQFGTVQGSLSDLLGLRLSLPLQGQGRAVTAREKVSGAFFCPTSSSSPGLTEKGSLHLFSRSRPAQISDGPLDSTEQLELWKRNIAIFPSHFTRDCRARMLGILPLRAVCPCDRGDPLTPPEHCQIAEFGDSHRSASKDRRKQQRSVAVPELRRIFDGIPLGQQPVSPKGSY